LFELVTCLDLSALIDAVDDAHAKAAMLVALLRRC
jgi:hypothetical protein